MTLANCRRRAIVARRCVAPGKVRFKHRLDGFDVWNQSGAGKLYPGYAQKARDRKAAPAPPE